MSQTKLLSLTTNFKQLMAQKGSKCVCLKHLDGLDVVRERKCGDYCKKLGAGEQRHLITQLLCEHHKRWRVIEENRMKNLSSQVITEQSENDPENE